MKILLKTIVIIIPALLISQLTFGQKQIDSESRQILDNMISVVGSYEKLRSMKDVDFHYIYDKL